MVVKRLRRRSGTADTATDDRCEHLAALDAAAEPESAGEVCQDCDALGDTAWAHLRKCLQCGHVACCDSSPHRHATEHFERTGHPVMRSYEPGESWRWCYVDSTLDDPAALPQ
ncbi:UBP-type zinc finger domain-containing protein [Mycobacterium sp. MYCO198283]|uniref:UBP-type zinc finger domain-containing protein n=1 Tax=Mycobacterium sp. MYCO198283 TaxID=2883505 RepID=UPI001E5A36B6|nr:UBP-type zinc finger domain-containing protein [Mycobacterium sp. MYCO198283]MCG5432170.1 UBP-type zinc finger domain-containing protein [Mycobacterium sp. MYCO198283]